MEVLYSLKINEIIRGVYTHTHTYIMTIVVRALPQFFQSWCLCLVPWRLCWPSQTIIIQCCLYRMKFVFSLICSCCFKNETVEHILLHCPHLVVYRCLLLADFYLCPPITYSSLIAAAFDSDQSLTLLICFTRSAFPSLN